MIGITLAASQQVLEMSTMLSSVSIHSLSMQLTTLHTVSDITFNVLLDS